uniref:Uncharacterized protein n=1 Tax=Anopheles merus TaxID=30066 RepID=A0A182VG66_ANOME
MSIWLSSRSDAKLDWRAEDVPVVVALTEISTVGVVVVVPPGAGSSVPDGAAPDPDDVATFEDEEEDEEEEAEDDEEEEEEEDEEEELELPESPAIAFITFRFIKWPALAA